MLQQLFLKDVSVASFVTSQSYTHMPMRIRRVQECCKVEICLAQQLYHACQLSGRIASDSQCMCVISCKTLWRDLYDGLA